DTDVSIQGARYSPREGIFPRVLTRAGSLTATSRRNESDRRRAFGKNDKKRVAVATIRMTPRFKSEGSVSLSYLLSTLFFLAVCIPIPELAWGQQVTAAITGKVTDPSDSAIAGAKVAAKDIARGTVWTTETNLEGFYSLQRVPIGRYELRVEMAGFQTAVHPPFEVVLNQTARLDFRMQLGVVNQTVGVQGAALLVTDSMQLGAVIESTTNQALPLATRNYIQLTLLLPGTTHPDPSTFTNGTGTGSGRPHVNGNREQANNFLLDGIDNNQ